VADVGSGFAGEVGWLRFAWPVTNVFQLKSAALKCSCVSSVRVSTVREIQFLLCSVCLELN